MMTMGEVTNIHEDYMLRAEQSEYNNERENEICILTSRLVALFPMAYWTFDQQVNGRFTKRFEETMKELEVLLS